MALNGAMSLHDDFNDNDISDWVTGNAGTSGQVAVANGVVSLSGPSTGYTEANLTRSFAVIGDFTVGADFTGGGANGAQWRYGIQLDFTGGSVVLHDTDSPTAWYIYLTGPSLSNPQAVVAQDVGGTAGMEGSVGTLSIKRTGSDFAFNVTQGGVTTAISQQAFSGLGDLTAVSLRAWSHGTPVSVAVDDFFLEAGATAGDRVWDDADGDGVQDAGEAGLADVDVNLIANGMVVQSAVTDVNGNYHFDVTSLAPTYQVQVVLPTGYVASPRYAGAAGVDSNLDAQGYSETFTLTPGESRVTVDGGLVLTPQWVGGPAFTWSQASTTLTNPGPQSSSEGQAVSLAIVATGTTGTVSYTAVNLPAGLSIDPASGVIAGTIGSEAADDFAGSYDVTVIVSSSAGAASTSFNWAVANTTQAGTPLALADQTSNTGEDIYLQVGVNNPDGGVVEYSATGLPSGLSIDAGTGAITGSIDRSAAGASPAAVTVSVRDVATNQTTSQSFSWTVTLADHAPGLGLPDDQFNSAGDTVTLDVAGADQDGDLVTYTATGLPAGLAIDPATGVISGTISSSAYSETAYSVTVTASDDDGSDSQTFLWSVSAVQVTPLADQAVVVGDSVSLAVTASDARSFTLSYSADDLPSGLSIDAMTGVISGVVAAGAAPHGPYTSIITATAGAYSASVAIRWTVAPSQTPVPPVVTAPAAQTTEVGGGVSLQVVASSPDGYLITYDVDGLPEGLTMDPFTGLITGSPTEAAASASPYTVTVTADAGVGGVTTQTFSWTVDAAPAPTPDAPQGYVDSGAVHVVINGFRVPTGQSVSAYTATINWGDGTTSAGTLTTVNGVTNISGDHAYSNPSAATYSVTVEVIKNAQTVLTATRTVTVRPSAAVGAGVNVRTAEGESASQHQVAVFRLPGGLAPGASLTAMVNFGDGTPDQVGTVTEVNGEYSVSALHGYVTAGLHAVRVTVERVVGGVANWLATFGAVYTAAEEEFPLSAASAAALMSYINPEAVRDLESDGGVEAQKNRAQTMASKIHTKATAGALSGVSMDIMSAPISAAAGPLQVILSQAKKAAAGNAGKLLKELASRRVDVHTFQVKEGGNVVRMTLLNNRATGDYIVMYEGQVGSKVTSTAVPKLTDEGAMQKFLFTRTGKIDKLGARLGDPSAIKWHNPR